MNILMTGGTGFIGRRLVNALLKEGHKITLFVRDFDKAVALFGQRVSLIYRFHDIDYPIDAVINLAGEPIFGQRWTKHRKRKLYASRVGLTRHLVKWLATLDEKPVVMISGSAIGFYGDHPEGIPLNEYGKTRECFPSQLCNEWEFEAMKARSLGIRVCLLRTGVVLDKNEGALQKMWRPFSLGLGGNVGSGSQWFSWIHISDMVSLVLFLLKNNTIEGPVNATAPEPVTYNTFTKALAKVLSKPHIFPMPAFILKLLFGESAELLTEGQRVIPEVLLDNGFHFEFKNIDTALTHIAASDG